MVGDVAARNRTREEEFLRPLDFEHAVFFSDVDTMLSRKGAPLSSAAWVPKVSFVNSWRLWVWSVSADVAALLSLLVLLSLFRALFVAAVIHAVRCPLKLKLVLTRRQHINIMHISGCPGVGAGGPSRDAGSEAQVAARLQAGHLCPPCQRSHAVAVRARHRRKARPAHSNPR